MNDVWDNQEQNKLESEVDQAFQNQFFPLCIDGTFYGNESRFINHSCDPNLKCFNLVSDGQSSVFHQVGLFAVRKIKPGEELTIDYMWDENANDVIAEDVPCLCGSAKCRGLLMRSKKLQRKG